MDILFVARVVVTCRKIDLEVDLSIQTDQRFTILYLRDRNGDNAQ